jgi:1-hydroxycarotenoid 3,4-desaturase
VVLNADVAALADGKLGRAAAGAVSAPSPRARSLSALTWNLVARTEGFPLLRHNVFFSADYAAEFGDLFRHRRLPRRPTVYVCAQDRDDRESGLCEPERLLCLVNAPPNGDRGGPPPSEITSCEEQTFRLLEHCGLRIERRSETTVMTTPADFERLFPATGGALYGQASHGWMASFRRPGARSRMPGLYLAGGSTHPGAGIPMAALSGQLAAASLLEDLASRRRFHRVAMRGGMSTP